MATTITFRIEESEKEILIKETKEKGLKNISNYIHAIVLNRHKDIIIDGSSLEECTKKLNDALNTIEKLEKELSVEKDSESFVRVLSQQLKHVKKRAWEISRISEQQLMQNFKQE